MRGELIREKLHRGERVYGSHMCKLRNPVTGKLAQPCELDFAFICNEHIPIDRTETSMICQFYAAHGVSPIVRIPDTQPGWAARALDGGAEGIVVPYVETVEQVSRIVGAVKYRPIKGEFLADILAGRREPTQETEEFLQRHNRDNYVIIGIESVPAVDRLAELISVAGVDGVFLGPHDLTVSMEIPEQYDHPKFADLVEDVIRQCRQAGVGVGLHLIPALKPSYLQRFLKAGMNWILHVADIVIMRNALNDQLRQLRQMAGDVYHPPFTTSS